MKKTIKTLPRLGKRTEQNKNENRQFTRYFWGLGNAIMKKRLIPKLIPIPIIKGQ